MECCRSYVSSDVIWTTPQVRLFSLHLKLIKWYKKHCGWIKSERWKRRLQMQFSERCIIFYCVMLNVLYCNISPNDGNIKNKQSLKHKENISSYDLKTRHSISMTRTKMKTSLHLLHIDVNGVKVIIKWKTNKTLYKSFLHLFKRKIHIQSQIIDNFLLFYYYSLRTNIEVCFWSNCDECHVTVHNKYVFCNKT
jgi:hypothetical protein